jgi:hypothetical protein
MKARDEHVGLHASVSRPRASSSPAFDGSGTPAGLRCFARVDLQPRLDAHHSAREELEPVGDARALDAGDSVEQRAEDAERLGREALGDALPLRRETDVGLPTIVAVTLAPNEASALEASEVPARCGRVDAEECANDDVDTVPRASRSLSASACWGVMAHAWARSRPTLPRPRATT